MGGILLPASVQKKPTQGKVEKAGTAKAVRVSFLYLTPCTSHHAAIPVMLSLLWVLEWQCISHARAEPYCHGAWQHSNIRDLTSCALQDGEKVVYSKYAGTELKVSGTEYVILKVRIVSTNAS